MLTLLRQCSLLLDLRSSLWLWRLRPAGLLPQEHQRVVLVGEPGPSQSNQRFRLPRLVRHWRFQPPEASAWQQRTDSAGWLLFPALAMRTWDHMMPSPLMNLVTSLRGQNSQAIEIFAERWGRVLHGSAEQLLRGRDQVARHWVPPREANHLWRRGGTPPVCQADLPQYPHPLRGAEIPNLVSVVIYLLFYLWDVVDYPTVWSRANGNNPKVWRRQKYTFKTLIEKYIYSFYFL